MNLTEDDQLAVNVLLSYLREITNLPEDLTAQFKAQCQVMRLSKNKFILSPVDNNQYTYFLIKGTVRGFVRDGANEITTFFAFEKEIFSAIRKPGTPVSYSPEFLQALESCLLVGIPYSILEDQSMDSPELSLISRHLSSLQYFCAAQRAMLARIPRAVDRYQKTMSDERFGAGNIPLRYLASYLAIRLETLSRIRGKQHKAILDLVPA